MTNKPNPPPLHLHPNRHLRLTNRNWQQLTAGYAVLIAVLAVWPFSPETSRVIGPLDKLLHLCEYLLLAWCVVQAARASGWSRDKALTLAFLLPTGFGVFLEGVQSVLPYRSAELWDLVANTMGACLGMQAGWLVIDQEEE